MSIVSGSTPKTGVAKYWGGSVLWATPADLSALQGPLISSTSRQLTDEGLRSCGATILPPGSVLLSSRAPIGHVAINTVPMATNQGFKSLVPSSAVDTKYLYHWLLGHRSYLQSLGNGATFKEISKTVVEKIQIPLPAPDEQRRIAAILDQADALRARHSELREHFGRLPQAIFLDMFGDPAKAASSVPFRQIASLTGGRNLVGLDAQAASTFRVLKISAVTTGIFREDESKPLPVDYTPPPSHLVRPDDLLMSRANTSELVGAVAHVANVRPNMALPDKIWRFNWCDERSVPTFYHALFRSATVRRWIGQLASGTGGSMKNISKAKLESLQIPAVPFERQQEFADRVAAVPATHDMSVDRLFDSLQARAFRGEL